MSGIRASEIQAKDSRERESLETVVSSAAASPGSHVIACPAPKTRLFLVHAIKGPATACVSDMGRISADVKGENSPRVKAEDFSRVGSDQEMGSHEWSKVVFIDFSPAVHTNVGVFI